MIPIRVLSFSNRHRVSGFVSMSAGCWVVGTCDSAIILRLVSFRTWCVFRSMCFVRFVVSPIFEIYISAALSIITFAGG